MTHWINTVATIAIATVCTVATSALVLYTTQYLINDHHATVLKNSFKNKAKRLKGALRAAEVDYRDILSKDINEADKLTIKKKLEIEELLIRILERLDELQPKSLLESTSTNEHFRSLDQNAIKLMQTQINQLSVVKKSLIDDIQVTCDQISKAPISNK
ncbi:hypothetical protein BC833DRAFT_593425 [Globomyces pollinis-pini]|nr:hypothetical protein BC833DRAFT_593425 [Globomyces pollinis-pini]KAJ3000692.1 hypothetical protein HDV02_004377 [Globomyces sp. JEL0801]